MKINTKERNTDKKREPKRIRREGFIPCVLYGPNKESKSIKIPLSEFEASLREIPSGRLSTTIFTLVDEKGKETNAIVKDIQYDVTSYNVLHLDFEELDSKVSINIRVPIECIGAVDCVGIKLGGVLRQVIRGVRVNCLPDKIPSCFVLDIKELRIKQYKKLKDIKMPEGVKPLANLNEVAVVIAKR